MPGSSLLRCSPKSACPEGGRARQEVGAVSMGSRAAGAAGPADPREFAKSLETCKKGKYANKTVQSVCVHAK